MTVSRVFHGKDGVGLEGEIEDCHCLVVLGIDFIAQLTQKNVQERMTCCKFWIDILLHPLFARSTIRATQKKANSPPRSSTAEALRHPWLAARYAELLEAEQTHTQSQSQLPSNPNCSQPLAIQGEGQDDNSEFDDSINNSATTNGHGHANPTVRDPDPPNPNPNPNPRRPPRGNSPVISDDHDRSRSRGTPASVSTPDPFRNVRYGKKSSGAEPERGHGNDDDMMNISTVGNGRGMTGVGMKDLDLGDDGVVGGGMPISTQDSIPFQMSPPQPEQEDESVILDPGMMMRGVRGAPPPAAANGNGNVRAGGRGGVSKRKVAPSRSPSPDVEMRNASTIAVHAAANGGGEVMPGKRVTRASARKGGVGAVVASERPPSPSPRAKKQARIS